MNFIFGVTILLLVNMVTSKQSSKESSPEDKSEESYYKRMLACKTEAGATDIDLQQMNNHTMPTTKSAKCLIACYLNKLGVMAQEKFLPEKLIEYMRHDTLISSNGKTAAETIKEITDECKIVSDADKCESALKIVMCLNAASNKQGFPDVFPLK